MFGNATAKYKRITQKVGADRNDEVWGEEDKEGGGEKIRKKKNEK